MLTGELGHGEVLHLGRGRAHLKLSVVTLSLAAAGQEILHEATGAALAPGVELGAVQGVAVNQGVTYKIFGRQYLSKIWEKN